MSTATDSTTVNQNTSLRANPLPENPHWLRVNTMGAVGVDRENKIIRGYVVAQEGPFRELNPRGEFDETSLRQIINLMKQEPAGLKSAFGHPSLSSDGLGKYLGRAKNPWLGTVQVMRDGQPVELKAVRADLHLSETAFEGNPNGNLGEYVMNLAEKDPGAFGSSLRILPKEEYRLDNHKRPRTDGDGNPLPPLWRPLQLHASDVVDNGAACDAMLSADLPDEVVRQGYALLDRQFEGQPRNVVKARVTAWLNGYLESRHGPEVPAVGQSDVANSPKSGAVLGGDEVATLAPQADAEQPPPPPAEAETKPEPVAGENPEDRRRRWAHQKRKAGV